MSRCTPGTAYRAGLALAILGILLLAWLSLGVGIIGADGDLANLMYFGVIGLGGVGAILARLKPAGMARAAGAVALGQALVATIALLAPLGRPWSGPLELVLLNGFSSPCSPRRAGCSGRPRTAERAAARAGQRTTGADCGTRSIRTPVDVTRSSPGTRPPARAMSCGSRV